MATSPDGTRAPSLIWMCVPFAIAIICICITPPTVCACPHLIPSAVHHRIPGEEGVAHEEGAAAMLSRLHSARAPALTPCCCSLCFITRTICRTATRSPWIPLSRRTIIGLIRLNGEVWCAPTSTTSSSCAHTAAHIAATRSCHDDCGSIFDLLSFQVSRVSCAHTAAHTLRPTSRPTLSCRSDD